MFYFCSIYKNFIWVEYEEFAMTSKYFIRFVLKFMKDSKHLYEKLKFRFFVKKSPGILYYNWILVQCVD